MIGEDGYRLGRMGINSNIQTLPWELTQLKLENGLVVSTESKHAPILCPPNLISEYFNFWIVPIMVFHLSYAIKA